MAKSKGEKEKTSSERIRHSSDNAKSLSGERCFNIKHFWRCEVINRVKEPNIVEE